MLVRHRFVSLTPKITCYRQRIDSVAVPPPSLIPGRMIFRMVDGAKGHSKFVADLKRESSGLRVTNVMSM